MAPLPPPDTNHEFNLNPFARAPGVQPQQQMNPHYLLPPPAPANPHSTGWGSFNNTTGAEQSEQARLHRIQDLLTKKLGPEYVSNRQGGGGMKLSYVEGWRMINLANEIFGFNGWCSEIKALTVDYMDVNAESQRWSIGVSATVRVWLPKEGITHEDVGYGKIDNVKCRGDGLDKCKKEAVTDGLKRALRQYGSLLGNCLYDKSYINSLATMAKKKIPLDWSRIHHSTDIIPPAIPLNDANLSDARLPPPPQNAGPSRPVPPRSAAPPPPPPPQVPAPALKPKTTTMAPPPAPAPAKMDAPATTTTGRVAVIAAPVDATRVREHPDDESSDYGMDDTILEDLGSLDDSGFAEGGMEVPAKDENQARSSDSAQGQGSSNSGPTTPDQALIARQELAQQKRLRFQLVAAERERAQAQLEAEERERAQTKTTNNSNGHGGAKVSPSTIKRQKTAPAGQGNSYSISASELLSSKSAQGHGGPSHATAEIPRTTLRPPQPPQRAQTHIPPQPTSHHHVNHQHHSLHNAGNKSNAPPQQQQPQHYQQSAVGKPVRAGTIPALTVGSAAGRMQPGNVATTSASVAARGSAVEAEGELVGGSAGFITARSVKRTREDEVEDPRVDGHTDVRRGSVVGAGVGNGGRRVPLAEIAVGGAGDVKRTRAG